ncbi:hypothetical protein GCM10017778_33070 [Streptomyces vinaceus]|nr:hypothetical protein GCM10017778_33070 [Streptomyces vinaceus]
MGTAVFPDAPLKVFLQPLLTEEPALKRIKPADDAIQLDTTELTTKQILERISDEVVSRKLTS